jgi:hypothetical protein
MVFEELMFRHIIRFVHFWVNLLTTTMFHYHTHLQLIQNCYSTRINITVVTKKMITIIFYHVVIAARFAFVLIQFYHLIKLLLFYLQFVQFFGERVVDFQVLGWRAFVILRIFEYFRVQLID